MEKKTIIRFKVNEYLLKKYIFTYCPRHYFFSEALDRMTNAARGNEKVADPCCTVFLENA
jgi:hypothetical protein